MKRALWIFLFGLVAALYSCGGTDLAKVDEGTPLPDIVAEPDLAPVPDISPEPDIPPPQPDIQDPPVVFEDPEDINDFCESLEMKTVWHEIVIPPNDSPCPWGEGDNAEMDQGTNTARIEQLFPIEMPPGTVICDLTFDFSESVGAEAKTLQYDDHFLLTLNGAVIIASRESWVENFQDVMGLRMYDWNGILGQSIGGSAQSPYCLGEAEELTQCAVPDSDEEGVIEFAIDQSLVTKLSFLGFYAQSHAFNFITTGDNDPETDCNHTELIFRILVKYVSP